MTKKFSEIAFNYISAECEFTDAIYEADDEFEYSHLTYDSYDNSVEFYNVDDECRLNEEIQRIIFDAGFSKVFLNHKNSWQTHYSYNQLEEFTIAIGWRRLIRDNHIYVEEFPPSWPEDWLISGYVVVTT